MKNGKITGNNKNFIFRQFVGSKFKEMTLLPLAFFVSLSLTAQVTGLKDNNVENIGTKAQVDQQLLQRLFLKVQINPPHNQSVADYTGLAVHVLSIKGGVIVSGALDQKGQVVFHGLTTDSLGQVQIRSAATGDEIIVDNPNGAVVGFAVSSLAHKKDI